MLGCAVAAVGFYLWGHSLTELSVSDQWYFIVLAGAGVGLVLSPANTDALNRVPRSRYGEATGITQTVRNFGSSLGLAVLGSILILENRSNLESTAAEHGVPKQAADEIADAISQGSGSGGESPDHLPRPDRQGRRQHPPRLRPRLAHRLLRDGRGDGGRLRRLPRRDAGRQSRNRGRRLRRADFRRPRLTSAVLHLKAAAPSDSAAEGAAGPLHPLGGCDEREGQPPGLDLHAVTPFPGSSGEWL